MSALPPPSRRLRLSRRPPPFAPWPLAGLLALALALLLAGPVVAASAEPGPDVGVLTLDAAAASALPHRFRTCFFPLAGQDGALVPSREGLNGLRVSGSSQFSLAGLALMREQFPPRAVIVDLRRESHGFLGGNAVSWRLPDNQGNPGRDAAFVAEAEAALLAAIDERPDIVVAREAKRDGPTPLTLGPLSAVSEAQAAASLGLGYLRLAVSDHTRPDDAVVERFVRFYRSLPPDVWLHFHCRGGAGRTTTFMTLVDMLRNAQAVAFEDIIARQKALGGSDLAKTSGGSAPGRDALARQRLEFLRRFYDYARANPGGAPLGWTAWLAGSAKP